MVNDSPTIKKLRSKIGSWEKTGVYEIERGMIRRFVQAVDNPNIPWGDDEYAKKNQYGNIVAPPAFIVIVGNEQMREVIEAILTIGGGLHGSTELECYQPVRPGDRITVTTKVGDMYERQGKKAGKLVFIGIDMTYTNHKQELVAKCRQTSIIYQIEEAKYD